MRRSGRDCDRLGKMRKQFEDLITVCEETVDLEDLSWSLILILNLTVNGRLQICRLKTKVALKSLKSDPIDVR
jgi:hypothetical protein